MMDVAEMLFERSRGVRLATPDDVAAIVSILKDSFAEYEPQYTPQAYSATTPSADGVRRRLDQGPIWIATAGETAIGTVAARIEPDGLHVRGMAIVQDARGTGVADALLQRAEEFARECGLRRIYLRTTPFLLRAIRCYQRYGFRRSQDPPSDLHGTPLFTMEKHVDQILIRKAREDDLDEVATFWQVMFQEAGLYDGREWPADWRERYRTHFARRMRENEAAFYLAVDVDRIIGTAAGIVRDGYPTEVLNRRTGYIFNVRVDPEYRKRGLAAQLTQRCIDYLTGIGCAKIRLHAAPAARNIYTALGFVPTTEMELKIEPKGASSGN